MRHDIVIVGAGPVGATLALALADADLDMVVLDARAAGSTPGGDRALALSHGTRLILERLGAWDALRDGDPAVTPITEIDVSQAGGCGSACLRAADEDLPALGYIVAYHALQRSLDLALERRGIAVRHGAAVAAIDATDGEARIHVEGSSVVARVVAVADGSGAAVPSIPRTRHDYRQHAVVAKVRRSEPHRGRAFERFTAQGPIALLPEGDDYGLVWAMVPERAQHMQQVDEATFLRELAQSFGGRVRDFTDIGARRSFPLVLEYVHDPVAPRCVLLGNAAQTLHPVAGQGFNVGLRDAFEFSRLVLDTPREQLGSAAMLARYARQRRPDRMAGVAFTHGLVRLFGNDIAPLRWPRGLALALLDAIPVAKHTFTRMVMFGLR